MEKHHLLISGTGRAGTTFLVQLLTQLGFDTGFANASEDIHAGCNAGMEWQVDDIARRKAPYVVKSPALCEHIEEVLQTPGVVIDCMIIPMRDLYSAAESRRTNARNAKSRKAPGALWLTKNPRKQEAALAVYFHHLVHALVKHNVPMIWLHFPRLVKDPAYLYAQLQPVLNGKDFSTFEQAFRAVSRPELVHEFKPQPSAQKNLFRRLSAWVQGRPAHRLPAGEN